MDRLKHLVETKGSQESHHSGMTGILRPPALRTYNTFDDDEAFSNVALHLLSRREALGLSTTETIKATLISPSERESFLDGLHARKARATHLSPSTASLVESIDTTFGDELCRIVYEESKGDQTQAPSEHETDDGTHPPITPRHIKSSASSNSSGSSYQHSQQKKNRRRFFPDSDSKSKGFFRSSKVQNVDWKLTEAIEQVQSLRLDGSPEQGKNGYKPPSPMARLFF